MYNEYSLIVNDISLDEREIKLSISSIINNIAEVINWRGYEDSYILEKY